MFERVVFPAPFSPSSACTSPAAASKVTPSFATTPGKLFVIPAMRTAGAGEAPGGPAPLSSCSWTGGASPIRLAGWRDVAHVPDDALHEPLHRVEIGKHLERLPLGHHQLALLVVDRPPEDVELAGDDRLFLRLDQRT